MFRLKQLSVFIFFFVSLLILSGCNGKKVTINLVQIDCEKDKINVTVTKNISGAPNNWVVRIDINVTCNGQPVPNAQINYSSSYFSGDSATLTTDAQGNASRSQRIQTNDRPDESLKVVIMKNGTDGSVEETTSI